MKSAAQIRTPLRAICAFIWVHCRYRCLNPEKDEGVTNGIKYLTFFRVWPLLKYKLQIVSCTQICSFIGMTLKGTNLWTLYLLFMGILQDRNHRQEGEQTTLKEWGWALGDSSSQLKEKWQITIDTLGDTAIILFMEHLGLSRAAARTRNVNWVISHGSQWVTLAQTLQNSSKGFCRSDEKFEICFLPSPVLPKCGGEFNVFTLIDENEINSFKTKKQWISVKTHKICFLL